LLCVLERLELAWTRISLTEKVNERSLRLSVKLMRFRVSKVLRQLILNQSEQASISIGAVPDIANLSTDENFSLSTITTHACFAQNSNVFEIVHIRPKQSSPSPVR